MGRKNILLTGRPRIGKSTLILRVVEKLRQARIAEIGGFYTLEMRGEGGRTGFSINTLDGRRGRLAEVGLASPFTLGRYGIDMEQFESIALPALEDAIDKGRMVVIDEIGYMELKSQRFRQVVQRALSAPQPVLATIMHSHGEFCDRIKARQDAALFTVTVENRDGLVDRIVEMVQTLLSGAGPQ